jgi:hypothetical protein
VSAIRDRLVPFREELAALTEHIGAAADADRFDGESTPAEMSEALAGLKAALAVRDTDGADAALAKLQGLSLTQKTRAAVADIAQQVLFGDFKKAAEAVNALLDLE